MSETVQTRRRFKLPIPRRDKPKKPSKAPAGQMTFWEHLSELRGRLIWSALAVLVCTGACFAFARDLVRLFTSLATQANPKVEIINTKLISGFSVQLSVAFYAGLLLASPIIVYHLIAFMAPALEPETQPGEPGYENEVKTLKTIKRSLIITIPLVAVFFVTGVLFCYYFILPPAVRFLTTFSEGLIDPKLDAMDYIGTLTKVLFWTGVVFEIPIVMYAIAKTRIVGWKKFLGWWKFAIVIALVIAAFINPSPDPMMQLVFAGPIMGLYFLGVLFARFA